MASMTITKGNDAVGVDDLLHDGHYIPVAKEERIIVKAPPHIRVLLREYVLKDPDFVGKFGALDRNKLAAIGPFGVVPPAFVEYAKLYQCKFRGSKTSFDTKNVRVETTVPCWSVRWTWEVLANIGVAAGLQADNR